MVVHVFPLDHATTLRAAWTDGRCTEGTYILHVSVHNYVVHRIILTVEACIIAL